MTTVFVYESQHDKTNKMSCAPSKDYDQPGIPRSLIRVFAVRMKKPLVQCYPLGGCPGWSESSLRQVVVLVLTSLKLERKLLDYYHDGLLIHGNIKYATLCIYIGK